jgi:hypothetical protein
MVSRQKRNIATRSQSSAGLTRQDAVVNHTPNTTGAGHQFGSYSILPPTSALTVQAKPKRDEQELAGDASGIESLSGYSMDDVNISHNSNSAASLQALAYAQGTDIHIAPGQEKHLPHEAWHVEQQKQGRVRPTMQMDDEREA